MRKQLPQLSKMSNEAKDDLIRELWEEIQNLRAKLKELEEGKVKKTSKNSSIPPSKEYKKNKKETPKTTQKAQWRTQVAQTLTRAGFWKYVNQE